VLLLLRHGESVWNADDRFAGWTDVPLSEVGRKEQPEPVPCSPAPVCFPTSSTPHC